MRLTQKSLARGAKQTRKKGAGARPELGRTKVETKLQQGRIRARAEPEPGPEHCRSRAGARFGAWPDKGLDQSKVGAGPEQGRSWAGARPEQARSNRAYSGANPRPLFQPCSSPTLALRQHCCWFCDPYSGLAPASLRPCSGLAPSSAGAGPKQRQCKDRAGTCVFNRRNA
jgi:hypothetical protein